MAEILDTNVLLRFLVGDDKKQLEQAKAWFIQAEKGKRTIVVKALVVAEACFVLESCYGRSRKEIAETMEVFLSQRWLQVEDREELLNLWSWYRQGLHFVDSFLLSWVKIHRAQLLSFDLGLHKQLKK